MDVGNEIEIDDRVEKLIWRGMGRRSVRQMAQDTGLSIEQVAYIRTQLLESVDELTIDQKRTKLLVDLQEISDQAREDYKHADDTDSGSKLLQVSVGAIKTVLEQLNRMEKNNTDRITELNTLRVQELVSLMQSVVDAGVREVADAYGLEEEDLFDIFNRKLAEEAAKRDLA